MTGRAAGYCAGNTVPGSMDPSFGRGWRGRGMGRGMGRGFGRRRGPLAYDPPPMAAPVPETDVEALKYQAAQLEQALTGVRAKIEELVKPQMKD